MQNIHHGTHAHCRSSRLSRCASAPRRTAVRVFAADTFASLVLMLTVLLPAVALAEDTGGLAKAAQNPVAAMISVPFQNNTLFGVGPGDDVANVLNIQPVIPFTVGGWNLVNRTIAP